MKFKSIIYSFGFPLVFKLFIFKFNLGQSEVFILDNLKSQQMK